ncbi:Zinc finger BED domain containing hypothetical protein 4-like [Phytophthora palmivora]|uniref:BED-type domain-containing protein n=1 Tax=Phytophthora palmivora TaxID=4796 RepID=A0A2P4YK72_9STRA|nr:Zinc finger BED domain containing hypothetical protein 4-like [Phytophthora palmivora]
MPKQREKAPWKFIDLICDDKYRAKQPLLSLYATCAWCKKCKCEIQYERSNSYHVTIHMEKIHSAELRNDKDEERQHKKRKVQILVHRQVNSVITSSSTDDACSPEGQERADDLGAICVAKSMRPFSIVEDKYLLKYVQHLNQVQGFVRVRKPWKVRERLEDVAVDLRVTLKQTILDECEFYSESSDIWTSKNEMGFICFTIHYLTREFKMRSWVLEVKRIKCKHDGDAIARLLSDTMNEWGLRIEECTKFLRDGASNVVNACKKLCFNDMSCLAHCIHLVVGAGIMKKNDLLASAQTDEEIKKGVNHQAREEIDNFVEDISHGGMRDLLSRCFEDMASSGDFSEVTLTQPTAEQWTTIRCLNVLLEPFAEATACLSGQSYPTLVVVIPVLRMVQRKLAMQRCLKGFLAP